MSKNDRLRPVERTEPNILPSSLTERSIAIEAHWVQHSDTWTPKEALFDILPRVVHLAIRTLGFVDHAQRMLRQEQDRTATSLAQEGLVLQSVLSWYLNFLLRTPLDVGNYKPAAEICIAQVYYHTVCIYLDGIFSYRPPCISHFAPVSPILDGDTINTHMASILELTQVLLVQGAAGILLFFPLRITGARAQDPWTRAEIL